MCGLKKMHHIYPFLSITYQFLNLLSTKKYSEVYICMQVLQKVTRPCFK